MEAQIDDALSRADFYTVHQLTLSMSQRKVKAKRFHEAKKSLLDGMHKLCSARQLMSAYDVARALLDVVELVGSWKPEDYGMLVEATILLWKLDVEHAVWRNFAGAIAKASENSAGFLCRLSEAFTNEPDSRWSDFSDIVVAAADASVFSPKLVEKLKASDSPDREAFCVVLELLVEKKFAPASAFIKRLNESETLTEVAISDTACSIPQAIKIHAEHGLVNLAQLLFLLAQRKGVPLTSLSEIKKHYKDVIAGPRIDNLLSQYEASFWQSTRRAQPQANPMASMLESLLGSSSLGQHPRGNRQPELD